jgi:hypothetical protein
MNELQKLKKQIMSFAQSRIDNDDLWKVIRSFRDAKNTNQTWITRHSATKNYDIARPALTRAVKDNLIRMNVEELICKEDLDMYLTLRGFFTALEDSNIVKTEIVKNKQQYLIMDTFKHNKSVPAYQTEVLAKVLEGFASQFLGIELSELISQKLESKV